MTISKLDLPIKGETQSSVSYGYRKADNSTPARKVRNSKTKNMAESMEGSVNNLVLNLSCTSEGKI